VQAETEKAVAAVAGISGKVAALEQIATAVAAAIEQQSAATHEIARSVAGTAAAADDMAARVERVGEEGRAAAARAGTLRAVAEEANAAVAQVRQVLVRTVRTATEAADRRRHPRQALDRAGQLSLSGGPEVPVRLRDIGAGGAAVEGAPAAAAPGAAARLRIAGLPEALEARVVEQGAADDGCLHLAFTAAAAASPALARLLAEAGGAPADHRRRAAA
jgi:methyl-accepting chemotaxis protein